MKHSIFLPLLAVLGLPFDVFAEPGGPPLAFAAGASIGDPKAAPPKAPGQRGPFDGCGLDAGDDSSDGAGLFGLRASVTHSNVAGDSDAIGLMVSAQGEAYPLRGFWSSRNVYHLAIGGGGAGFEGTLLGGWAGGVRIPVSAEGRHGPVLRLGMYGYLRGNDAFYASLLELPQLQIGYQYRFAKTLVEVGATGGAVLTGRSRIADTERRLLGAGFEYGGYAALQLAWLRFGVSANRLPGKGVSDEPVDVLEGALCGHVRGFGICSDARMTLSDAQSAADGRWLDARSVYAGISVGVSGE